MDNINQEIFLKNSIQKSVIEIFKLYQNGKFSNVVLKAEELIKKYPKLFVIWNILGASATQIGMFDRGIEAYMMAVKIKPDFADGYFNMGLNYQNQGKLDESVKIYKKTISIKPDYFKAYNNMGIALKDQGKLDSAIEIFKQVLTIKSDYAEALNNMGVVLRIQGKQEKAIITFKKALKIDKDYAEAHSNLGVALRDQGKFNQAILSYRKALFINPNDAETHHNLSFALLRVGKIKEGLNEHEWRWKTSKLVSHKRNFSKPMWDGKKSLKNKTILIWCEQGIGDTVNWSSCIPHLALKSEKCIFECQEKLLTLFKYSFPNVHVKPENKSKDPNRNDFDYHLPLGSIYKNFFSKIIKNRNTKPFLRPDPLRVNYWRDRLRILGGGPYIGISWKSSDMSPNRLPNYTLISEWYPLLSKPNLTFINLQYKNFKDDLNKVQNELGVTINNFDDLDHFNNLHDVAALYAALDCVVSIRNSVPLISSGVGTSTKLASWRQSPWNNILHNPVSSLVEKFEKEIFEPWEGIFDLIAKDIQRETKNWSFHE